MTIIKDGKEFIPHEAGECPVSPETYITVLFRDGNVCGIHEAGDWGPRPNDGMCWWKHEGLTDNDIVAYRPAEPEELI